MISPSDTITFSNKRTMDWVKALARGVIWAQLNGQTVNLLINGANDLIEQVREEVTQAWNEYALQEQTTVAP